jgi:predicted MFS family arabinose efflux permease
MWGIIWAFQETVFFALAMNLADTRIAASMFAIMMGISNLGAAVGDGTATALSDNLGFPGVFALLAGINLITIPVLVRLFRTHPELERPAVSN